MEDTVRLAAALESVHAERCELLSVLDAAACTGEEMMHAHEVLDAELASLHRALETLRLPLLVLAEAAEVATHDALNALLTGQHGGGVYSDAPLGAGPTAAASGVLVLSCGSGGSPASASAPLAKPPSSRSYEYYAKAAAAASQKRQAQRRVEPHAISSPSPVRAAAAARAVAGLPSPRSIIPSPMRRRAVSQDDALHPSTSEDGFRSTLGGWGGGGSAGGGPENEGSSHARRRALSSEPLPTPPFNVRMSSSGSSGSSTALSPLACASDPELLPGMTERAAAVRAKILASKGRASTYARPGAALGSPPSGSPGTASLRTPPSNRAPGVGGGATSERGAAVIATTSAPSIADTAAAAADGSFDAVGIHSDEESDAAPADPATLELLALMQSALSMPSPPRGLMPAPPVPEQPATTRRLPDMSHDEQRGVDAGSPSSIAAELHGSSVQPDVEAHTGGSPPPPLGEEAASPPKQQPPPQLPSPPKQALPSHAASGLPPPPRPALATLASSAADAALAAAELVPTAALPSSSSSAANTLPRPPTLSPPPPPAAAAAPPAAARTSGQAGEDTAAQLTALPLGTTSVVAVPPPLAAAQADDAHAAQEPPAKALPPAALAPAPAPAPAPASTAVPADTWGLPPPPRAMGADAPPPPPPGMSQRSPRGMMRRSVQSSAPPPPATALALQERAAPVALSTVAESALPPPLQAAAPAAAPAPSTASATDARQPSSGAPATELQSRADEEATPEERVVEAAPPLESPQSALSPLPPPPPFSPPPLPSSAEQGASHASAARMSVLRGTAPDAQSLRHDRPAPPPPPPPASGASHASATRRVRASGVAFFNVQPTVQPGGDDASVRGSASPSSVRSSDRSARPSFFVEGPSHLAAARSPSPDAASVPAPRTSISQRLRTLSGSSITSSMLDMGVAVPGSLIEYNAAAAAAGSHVAGGSGGSVELERSASVSSILSSPSFLSNQALAGSDRLVSERALAAVMASSPTAALLEAARQFAGSAAAAAADSPGAAQRSTTPSSARGRRRSTATTPVMSDFARRILEDDEDEMDAALEAQRQQLLRTRAGGERPEESTHAAGPRGVTFAAVQAVQTAGAAVGAAVASSSIGGGGPRSVARPQAAKPKAAAAKAAPAQPAATALRYTYVRP